MTAQPEVAVRRRRPDASLWISAAVLFGIVLAALVPSLLAPGDPLAIDPAEAMRPPGPRHPLGTDESGRDLLTRIVHGTRASLVIGVAATAIGLGIGIVFGAAAALGPRWLDWGVGRVLEVGFAFPGILLALLVIALWGPGVVTSTIAVGLSTAPGYARVVRGAMLGVRASAYVEADVVLGRSRRHRLVHTILPNTLAPLFALATLGLGQAIVWASALAFLGLGEPPPSPEWGALLSAGRTYLLTGSWWLTVFPGTAIVVAAVAATLLGRALQRRTRQAGTA
ncbi:ABC transporter permease [Pseudoclavibacter endophyticus]|uniref:ABC transporter permease n=1 Tax=Pseudoclavibacter endophyticus TaxID=1778590 RepID=A0A6H9WAE1_9MICO|nr:ABC transporter permease [Pseudoclavibacter endophyticus]KAB1646787.1 ABC transporter permease [Pseudoclavibacter endophyticus]GGA75558.1 ABC transporter permease [Pseudoclavibacter endophyticus]